MAREVWLFFSGIHIIFVGDLTADVITSILLETFKVRYGFLTRAKIATYEDSGQCKGYGFVGFTNGFEQRRAMRENARSFLVNQDNEGWPCKKTNSIELV